MTPPIQEPSLPRDVSGLAWGERQLARRPGTAPAVVEEAFVSWSLSRNHSTPVSRAAGSTPTAITGYETSFIDADVGHIATDQGGEIPYICGPGVYHIEANMDFGAGGTSTGNAYWLLWQIYFEVGSAVTYASSTGVGASYNWRWSWTHVSGAGVGAGAGPYGFRYRGGTYPFADLDTGGFTADNYPASAYLYVGDIIAGKAVPINLYLAQATNQAHDTNVTDSYTHELSVTRIGPTRSTSGAAYL